MVHHIQAHFDGRVIVPDEPLDLPINQRLRIQVESVTEAIQEERRLTPEEVEERLKRLRSLAGRFSAPAPSDEPLRRENLYSDE